MSPILLPPPLLTSPSSPGTLFSQTLNANNASLNGLTIVQRFEIAALTIPPRPVTMIRARWEAASITEGLIVTNAYVEHAAGAGDNYDFKTTPSQFLFSGAANVSIGIGATAWSDWLTFSYDGITPLLIAWYVGGGTGQDSAREITGIGSNIIRYTKTANDAATVNKTGYATVSGALLGINAIETNGF